MPLSILFLFTEIIICKGLFWDSERSQHVTTTSDVTRTADDRLAESSVSFSLHLHRLCPLSKASTLNLNKLHLSFKINLPSSTDGLKLVSQWRSVIKHWISVMSVLPQNKQKKSIEKQRNTTLKQKQNGLSLNNFDLKSHLVISIFVGF